MNIAVGRFSIVRVGSPKVRIMQVSRSHILESNEDDFENCLSVVYENALLSIKSNHVFSSLNHDNSSFLRYSSPQQTNNLYSQPLVQVLDYSVGYYQTGHQSYPDRDRPRTEFPLVLAIMFSPFLCHLNQNDCVWYISWWCKYWCSYRRITKDWAENYSLFSINQLIKTNLHVIIR